MMNEQVRKIMTKNPVTAAPQQNITEVFSLMRDKKLQQLPVVDKGQLVGLITTYDLWKDAKSADHENKKVADIMNTNVLTITPLDKVGTAAELFIDRRFKTLPVVNLRNELKGVVTAFDVIKHVFIQEYPEPILYRKTLLEDEE